LKIPLLTHKVPSPTAIADFFLPRYCPSCKSKLGINESGYCNNCGNKLKIADQERIKNEFERKFKNSNYISGFTAAFIFEKDKEIQSIIHSLKYEMKFIAGKKLGNQLCRIRRSVLEEWGIDIIIPVPLHHLKKAERGFNQSYFISKGLSSALGVKMKTGLIKRIKFTKSQTALTLKERAENVSGAFKVRRKNKIRNKNLLILDDVITTGATTNECGKVLLEAGTNKVFAASVAIAD